MISNLQPAVDRQPGHRRGDREEVGTQKITNFEEPEAPQTAQAYFKSFYFFQTFKKNIIFFRTQVVGSSGVKPHLKVYRGANPLACASALCLLTPRKSKK